MEVADGIGTEDFVESFRPELMATNGFHKKIVNGNASVEVLREATADGLRKKMQEVKEELGQINDRINDVMSEVLQRIETVPAKKNALLYNAEKYRDKKQSSKEGTLPDKEFLERNSLLTDLLEITHIRTVYNLFMVTFLLLFLNTIAFDIMESGTLFVGTITIQRGFAKFPSCMYIWSLMQLSTLALYVPFNIWAQQRLEFSPKSRFRKIWDYGWLTAAIIYEILFFIVSTRALINGNFPICSSAVILSEQIRFLMKTYAFIRSSAPRFLSYKPHSEVPRPKGPGFSQYLYFLFAPTLIYRDDYPRTKTIRWWVVIKSFGEVGIIIFYQAFIIERFIMPVYNSFDMKDLDNTWYIKSTLETSIPGILFFASGNYLLLHSWQNAWAEMLRFADRMFYKDWWNCTTYRTYYRTWNVVVHDWLYTYIYKDMYEVVVPCNKSLSMFAVFFISAIFHEHILAFAFGFFYPVLLVMFGGLGFSFMFAGKYVRTNVIMWLSFCLGNGMLFTFYGIEFTARYNCQPHPNYYVDLFVPRSWNCQRINA